uniref:Ion_trans domain-containing protein n=1 Tax=Macrostomum lignano TaxID=282301 RepID=A0A1I8IAE9_9PLAT
EFEFWGMFEQDIEPCCWTSYSQAAECKDTLAAIDSTFLTGNCAVMADVWKSETNQWIRFRRRMWSILEDPAASLIARIYVFVSMFVVVTSIVCFVSETYEAFRVPLPGANLTIGPTCTTACGVYVDPQLVSGAKYYSDDDTEPHPVLRYLDYSMFVFFTLELLMRLFFAPDYRAYFTDFLNWIDIVCVVTHAVSLSLSSIETLPNYTPTLVKTVLTLRVLRGLRVVRVLRIFKLVKHYNAFRILVYTIKISLRELMLMIVFLFVGAVIFGSIIHLVEKDSFRNIPYGLWWALVTMTTVSGQGNGLSKHYYSSVIVNASNCTASTPSGQVGYGDFAPRQAAGYAIGCVCVIFGVLTIAFTVPIVVNNFAMYYSHAQSRNKKPREYWRIKRVPNKVEAASGEQKSPIDATLITARSTAEATITVLDYELDKEAVEAAKRAPPTEAQLYGLDLADAVGGGDGIGWNNFNDDGVGSTDFNNADTPTSGKQPPGPEAAAAAPAGTRRSDSEMMSAAEAKKIKAIEKSESAVARCWPRRRSRRSSWTRLGKLRLRPLSDARLHCGKGREPTWPDSIPLGGHPWMMTKKTLATSESVIGLLSCSVSCCCCCTRSWADGDMTINESGRFCDDAGKNSRGGGGGGRRPVVLVALIAAAAMVVVQQRCCGHQSTSRRCRSGSGSSSRRGSRGRRSRRIGGTSFVVAGRRDPKGSIGGIDQSWAPAGGMSGRFLRRTGTADSRSSAGSLLQTPSAGLRGRECAGARQPEQPARAVRPLGSRRELELEYHEVAVAAGELRSPPSAAASDAGAAAAPPKDADEDDDVEDVDESSSVLLEAENRRCLLGQRSPVPSSALVELPSLSSQMSRLAAPGPGGSRFELASAVVEVVMAAPELPAVGVASSISSRSSLEARLPVADAETEKFSRDGGFVIRGAVLVVQYQRLPLLQLLLLPGQSEIQHRSSRGASIQWHQHPVAPAPSGAKHQVAPSTQWRQHPVAPAPSGASTQWRTQWRQHPVAPSTQWRQHQWCQAPSDASTQWRQHPVAPAPSGASTQWRQHQWRTQCASTSGASTQWRQHPVAPAPSGTSTQWRQHQVAPAPSGASTSGASTQWRQAPSGDSTQWRQHQEVTQQS